jgi:cytochrome b subunit of formate dehydrogenase
VLLDIIGLDEFVIFSKPVILPPMVAFDMLVMLVSGVLMFCAFTEFRPTIASMPNIAAKIGMIKTNCFLIACLSFLLTYKGLER